MNLIIEKEIQAIVTITSNNRTNYNMIITFLYRRENNFIKEDISYISREFIGYTSRHILSFNDTVRNINFGDFNQEIRFVSVEELENSKPEKLLFKMNIFKESYYKVYKLLDMLKLVEEKNERVFNNNISR